MVFCHVFFLLCAASSAALHAPLSGSGGLLRRSPPPVGSLCSFRSGDQIVVTDPDVTVTRTRAFGMTGTVLRVWGEGDDASDDEWGACCELAWDEPTLTVRMHPVGPVGYFAENEVELLERPRPADAPVGQVAKIAEGDRVRVTAEMSVKGESALGRLGTCIAVWEQCETDPACCCNELAFDAPLTVRLDAAEIQIGAPADTSSSGRAEETISTGYFREDEVARLTTSSASVPNTMPE